MKVNANTAGRQRPDFQLTVKSLVEEFDLHSSIECQVLDLASEVGELSKEVLKGTEYGRTTFVPGPNWSDELGDVLFSLVCIANVTGIDLLGSLEGALAKYRTRFSERGNPGSGR